jgi:outer membrane protein assembly factor BamE (lipoprotein component of BamABCDE complex)
LKFGQNITDKNNVLALEFNEYGILTKKDFYNKNHINKINFVNVTTETITREKNFVYSFLSSLRQKINKPVKTKKP